MTWLGDLQWCICMLKRKSGVSSEVFVFESVDNISDFCGLNGYDADAGRQEIKKIVKKYTLKFRK